jgi:glycosyltransferase involved in cell wall biosynthesis
MRKMTRNGLNVCQLCAVDFTLKHFLLPLIDGMHASGWEVTSVCAPGTAVAEMRAKGYCVETVAIARSMSPLSALKTLWYLMRLFKRKRFEVLHVHTPVAALLGRLAARLASIPLVVYTAHGFYFHEHMPAWQYRLFVMLERIAGRWTDLLFTQSAEDARTAVAEGIASSERVLAIGNGVDTMRFDPERIASDKTIRDELGIPHDAYVIGMIGRQVREKGFVEFLQAASKIVEKYSNVRFLVVGERLASDHAVGVEDELAAAQIILGEKLVATGLRGDIPELLSAMDLFCLPSWREGMPRTIIEAMMMAKPVLATDVRGSREEVVSEETGVLVPVRSPELLAAAMRRFLEAPAWGRSLGVAGRQRALRLYDENRVVAMQLERITEHARRIGLMT